MTITTLYLPLVAAIGLAVAVTAAHRRLPPVFASRISACALIAVCAAALPAVWLTGLMLLAHAPVAGGALRWCSVAIGMHHGMPSLITIPALALALHGGTRATRIWLADRRLRVHKPGSVAVTDDPQPYAVTLPGRGGQVLLSAGLVDLLDEREREVVFAHEAIHARHRHDRYLLLARVATALFPLLRPLGARLQFSLERWADEAAARQCGDRRFVAMTLAKVALSQPTVSPRSALVRSSLGFNGLGATARAEALLRPRVPPPTAPHLCAIFGGLIVTVGLTLVQIHHLIGVALTMCGV